jgi:hypothetical protein
VLPAETQTSASPVLTASIAFHIDDFQRPWRSAWLGLSSIRTDTSQWVNWLALESASWRARIGRTFSSRPNRTKRVSGRRSSTFASAGMITSGPWSHDVDGDAYQTDMVFLPLKGADMVAAARK